MVSDGPHGLRKQNQEADNLGINDSIKAVCFPAACATAASFDEELLYTMGSALGEECRAEDVSVLLGPGVNIKRSPLGGRNFEYFSEDPYLAGKLAASQIKGIQQWKVGTSLKHFAANNQEYRRMSISSELDERTLREIYLTGFEIAVKEASPWTLMCSYNRVNGEYASENKKLLTDILRDEWGFEGYVMSDWGAVSDRVKGLQAGLELEMPSSEEIQDAKIVVAVKDGSLPEEVLDRAVERMLTILFRYVDEQIEARFDREKHHVLATEIEKECAVLLKNNGILPLERTKNVAYIGGFAKTPRYQGGGSSHVNAWKVTNALEIARSKDTHVTYTEGFPADKDVIDEAAFAEAVAQAQKAEVAIVFAGLPDSFESEGYDRQHMHLPECQNELIARIIAVQKNTIVVLQNGAPVELPWADDVSAILELYLGGQGVGEAADALLYGETNPSGRLPETFPLRLEDNPSYLNFPGDGKIVHYGEGVYVGYRYYDTKKMTVRYPFGHGLSYTEFAYRNVQLSQSGMTDNDTVTVSLDVTNTGERAGKEVVQLYIKDCTGTPCRPVKELKGFAKVALQPGETKTVLMSINARSLAWYSEELSDWYAASGRYELLLAHSSQDIRCTAELHFSTAKRLPFYVDANTIIGDLLADPRTRPVVQGYLEQANANDRQQPESEIAKEAITEEMSRQMFENSPLRYLISSQHVRDEVVNDLNARLS